MSSSPSRPSESPVRVSGDIRAADEAAVCELYDELRRLAAARMAGEGSDHTLQPTALVHEAWLRLAASHGGDPRWNDRAHFFRAAALTMRRVLVDHARRQTSEKRGARSEHLSFENIDLPTTDRNERVMLIDEALSRFEQEDPDAARVVTLRFFGGFTNREIAAALEVTERTVERQWAFARARLMQLLQEPAA